MLQVQVGPPRARAMTWSWSRGCWVGWLGWCGVVGVAASGGSGAPGEHTGAVPDGDLFGDRLGDLVGVGEGAFGQVDDGFDDDLAVRAAAPGADLVDGDQRVAAFQ